MLENILEAVKENQQNPQLILLTVFVGIYMYSAPTCNVIHTCTCMHTQVHCRNFLIAFNKMIDLQSYIVFVKQSRPLELYDAMSKILISRKTILKSLLTNIFALFHLLY